MLTVGWRMRFRLATSIVGGATESRERLIIWSAAYVKPGGGRVAKNQARDWTGAGARRSGGGFAQERAEANAHQRGGFRAGDHKLLIA